jgi:hypothetical protein
VELIGVLVNLFSEVVSILEDESVRIPAEEGIFEGFYLVEDGSSANS